jgi:hypothetical protein
MNGKLFRIWKESVVVFFTLLSNISPGTEKIHRTGRLREGKGKVAPVLN